MDSQANKYVWPRLGYGSVTHIGLAVEKATERLVRTSGGRGTNSPSNLT